MKKSMLLAGMVGRTVIEEHSRGSGRHRGTPVKLDADKHEHNGQDRAVSRSGGFAHDLTTHCLSSLARGKRRVKRSGSVVTLREHRPDGCSHGCGNGRALLDRFVLSESEELRGDLQNKPGIIK